MQAVKWDAETEMVGWWESGKKGKETRYKQVRKDPSEMAMLEQGSTRITKEHFPDHVDIKCSGTETEMHLTNSGERMRPKCLEQC